MSSVVYHSVIEISSLLSIPNNSIVNRFTTVLTDTGPGIINSSKKLRKPSSFYKNKHPNK